MPFLIPIARRMATVITVYSMFSASSMAWAAPTESEDQSQYATAQPSAKSAQTPLNASFELWGSVVPIHHPSIQKHVTHFSGRHKASLSIWMRRMAMYGPTIRKTLRQNGVPEDLVYVVMMESGFDPYARSNRGAVGLWQFIDSTATEAGLKFNEHVDERQDPIKSTRAAAQYLKRLKKRFGSWPLALAAFNGGPNRLERAIKRHNTNDLWMLIAQKGLFEETRRYVPKIMAVAYMIEHPEQFGLNGVVLSPMPAAQEVTIHRPVLLARVARVCRVDMKFIRLLNPGLKHNATPPKQSDYKLNIPQACVRAFVARIDGLSLNAKTKISRHTVRFGERIEDVARHHQVAPHVLRAHNGLAEQEQPIAGGTLTIAKRARGRWVDRSPLPRVILPNLPFRYKDRTQRIYMVPKAQTLSDIAKGFEVSVGDVVMWNDLDPKAALQKGMALQLFLPTSHLTNLALRTPKQVRVVQRRVTRSGLIALPTASTGTFYTIKEGDSLWSIAKAHKTSVKQIKVLNSTKKLDVLSLGMKLRVRR